MNETVTLPIEYKGEIIELPLTIVPLGYTYQLHVQLNEKKLVFEKDDEGQYRVIDLSGDLDKDHKNLVQAILATLEALK